MFYSFATRLPRRLWLLAMTQLGFATRLWPPRSARGWLCLRLLAMTSLAFLTSLLVLSFLLAGCFWESPDDNPEYLPLDDSNYPYADLPRVVIETDGFHEIRDRETEFPSKLQIYGKDTYESEVYSLTVRGRGNSSFKMPKYGMKL